MTFGLLMSWTFTNKPGWRPCITSSNFITIGLQGAGGGAAAALDVIHGYGSAGTGGVLRKRLQSFLAQQAGQGRLEFTPGEYVDSNLGHTVVRPIASLPVTSELLAEEVLAYCERPRSLQ